MRTLYPSQKRGWLKLFVLAVILVFVGGCTAMMPKLQPLPPYEINLNIKGVDAVKVEEEGDVIARTMIIPNQQGSLSHMSFICGDEGYIKIFSALSVGDVTNLWNDICVLEKLTDIRNVNLFINSPGGDAFSGLALADQIEGAKRQGFHFTAHASGIVASAALPVFAVCNKRFAALGTIFMVHETSVWKWPGRETASDIRSQNRLMDLLHNRYINKLVTHSTLSWDKWVELEKETTWFSVEEAQEWGLVDRIE